MGSSRRRIASVLVTGVLGMAGFFLPVWGLDADVRGLGTFREGYLHLRISGRGVTGQIDSFNRFGRMFGIRPLRPQEFVELRLFALAVAAAVAVSVLWAVQARPWQRAVALVLLWGMPAGAVGLTQLRLALMAYTRDPMASYYMDVSSLLLPVFGVKKILGATLCTRPGEGLSLLLAAAVWFTVTSRTSM